MEEDEDLVTLSTRLNRIKTVQKEVVSSHETAGGTNTEPRCDTPAPAPVAQDDQGGMKLGSLHMIRARLMLPPKPTIAANMDEGSNSSGKRAAPSASVGKSSSWDFLPPPFDIMGSLEEPTPLGEGTSSSHQNLV